MIIHKAFKFRLKTNETTSNKLSQVAGNCRFVWNKALALQIERLEAKEKLLPYTQLSKQLTEWRKDQDTLFLSETTFDSQQQKLRDLDRAFRDGFSKESDKKFPQFKRKGQHDSFRCVGYKQFSLDGNQVRIPKVGWVRFRKSREVEGTPKNITVSKSGEHWFVSIQTEVEINSPNHPASQIVGIDMGVAKFAMLSSGEEVKPLNNFRKLEKKLVKEQRKLSRKIKFSNNWKKQKRKIHRIHAKIADTRKDFLHKESTKIASENQAVIMEDLKVSNMSKSAKGTLDNPGKNVNAKSGLNKSILDQGWYEFRRQIEYKLNWLGGKLILIKPQYTSQKCSVCGHVSKDNRKSQSKFLCVKCNHSQNADLNASLNILAAGHAVLACGDIRPVAA